MKSCVHQFEIFAFSKIILGPHGHILNLLLLFTNCCKIAKHDLELPLFSESYEFHLSLSLIISGLISDSPLCKSSAEYIHAFFLKYPHHLGLEMSFGLLRFMIIKERLERTGAYLSVIEGICISILSLLQGVHNKRSHDLHVCAESPEN